jgi:sulfur-carrier protein adenylyltransferase/sulfurtransferase
VPSERYIRQITLPEVGILGQEHLTNAKILVVGAGGLGCPALLYLGAAGIGTIGIIDPDTIALSNLHRQILYTAADCGKLKADTAAHLLSCMYPDVVFQPYPAALNAANAIEIFSKYDIILDGTDTFAAKFLINDACVQLGKPFVYGAILGFSGEMAVFTPSAMDAGACYRCLYDAPPNGHIPNCAEAGVMGALAGMIGAAQALAAIKILLGKPDAAHLWLYDSWNSAHKNLKIPQDPACICAHPERMVLTDAPLPACSAPSIESVSFEQAQTIPGAVFVDVREANEWNAGHIADALHLPLSLLQRDSRQAVSRLPSASTYILYCQHGIRSKTAAILLQMEGLNVQHLQGGYGALKN